VKAHIRRFARLPTLACTLLTGLIAISACGASTPTPTPTGTLAGPTVGLTPTVDPRAELPAMVAAAGVATKDLGGATPKSEETVGKLAMPCNTPLAAENVAAHSWTFSAAKPPVVSNSVFAYYPEVGTRVVDQIRPALTTCKTWTWANTWEMAVLGEFPVTAPAGVDNAIAYCHRGTVLAGTNKGDTVYLCDGMVSRGHLVSQLGTVELTLAAAQDGLKKALPLAGAGLVRAVAAP
jgi:hypothetical protein